LKSAVPTIEYLQQRGARVVLISHISGKGTETLAPMYDAMKSMVKSLSFCPVSVGEEARAAVRALHPGQVVMLENLRRNAGEEANDPAFAKELASLADVFVQDSFDVCHRKHASVVGVPEFLPSYAGLTVENEVRELTKAVKPRRPSLAVIAGAKFSTKEPVLKKLLKTYDHVAIGGALANDFIHAKGYSVGASLVSTDGRTGVAAMLKNKNLIVPADVIAAPLTADRSSGRAANVSDIHTGEAALDVGPETAKLISALAQKAKTVLWNGPLGLYEHGFIDATQVLARGIASGKAHSVLGGGDTIAAVEALGLINKFSFVSTGGGAMLDFLAEGTLPGLEALSRH
jgi:phosphoglycerate kinase